MLVWSAAVLAAGLAYAGPRTERPGSTEEPPEQGVWEVEPDPAPAQARPPAGIEQAPPIPFREHLIYPSFAYSAVVGYVPPGKDAGRLEFADLRRMKRIGTTVQPQGKLGDYRQMAVSPDGAYLAAIVKGDANIVEVWSIATGKSLYRIKVDENPQMKVGMIDFAGKDRLLTMKHKGLFVLAETDSTYQVWDLKTGGELTQFTIPLVFSHKWGAISPGGRYLAMEQTAEGYHIVFWDLTTGKLAGQFDFQGQKDPWGQASGLAFTPDGEKLAMVWILGKKPDCFCRLLSWDVSTHKLLHDHRIGYEISSMPSVWSAGGAKSLQWVPDGSGWLLVGHLLVDAESGAVVGKIPPEPHWDGEVINRRFLGTNFVTSINRKKKEFIVVKKGS
jgi:WD40 repeat protein